jgi:hypothetical protein
VQPLFQYVYIYIYIYIYSIPSFRCGTQGFHKNPPSHSILGISFNLRPGLINSFGLFDHRSSPCIPLSPPAPLPWGFHSRACLAITSDGFRSVWPSLPHLRFLICKSILGCFVRFHGSLFIIWSGQKILNIFLRRLLIKTCSLAVILFEFRKSSKYYLF